MKRILCTIIAGCIITGVLGQETKSYSHQVDSVLNLMTLREKIGQMIQYSNNKLLTGPSLDSSNHTEEIKRGEVGSVFNITSVERARQYQDLAMQSRLRIPLLFGLDVVHGIKTIFPIPLAEAASFNLDLIRETAHIAAEETSAVKEKLSAANAELQLANLKREQVSQELSTLTREREELLAEITQLRLQVNSLKTGTERSADAPALSAE